MVDPYRSASWQAFRNEVLRLDDYACTQCRKRASDGAVLHVHHKRYLAGKKPWEYPYHLCAVLCSGCHAAEHGIIPPQFGWELVGCDDLGDLSGECEYCGTEIRHTFMVTHAKWRTLEVGTDCCDKLTGTPEASEHRQYLDRRKRFVSSTRWKVDYSGELSIKQKDIYVSLVKREGAYRIRVRSKLGKKVFATELDAKAGVFDLVESGVIDDWLKKQDSKPRRR